MLSACSGLQSRHSPSEANGDDLRTPLEFFAYASITPDQREALLRDLRSRPTSEDSAVKLALLQSLPGSSAYEPGTARRRLSAISYSDNAQYAALARLRLNEMGGGGAAPASPVVASSSVNDAACRAEVQTLQDRLDKIVDIEKSLDNYGNGAKPNPAR